MRTNLTASRVLGLVLAVLLVVSPAAAQRKKAKKTAPPTAPVSELAKLRDEFVKATQEYKTSLEKLLAIFRTNVTRAEEKLATSTKLYEEGLISKTELEKLESAVKTEQAKVAEIQKQMSTADAQIAGVLVEAQADEQIAKNLALAKNRLIRTTSFTRYSGTGAWLISEAWKVQRFFSDSFKKPLPIAVFGQGAIHDRWRLDHRNAMDIQLHPDGPEGQALLNFLQKNGIPYLAFRSAIPGTATGPHIHIGRPSHRY
jgi:hypothetical protein